MLDARTALANQEDAGPRLPLILAKAEDNRAFIYNTHHAPSCAARRSRSVTAAMYTWAQGAGGGVSREGCGQSQVLLLASRTGCEQRTQERPLSFRALPRCGRSVGRSTRRQVEAGRWARARLCPQTWGGCRPTPCHPSVARREQRQPPHDLSHLGNRMNKTNKTDTDSETRAGWQLSEGRAGRKR